MPKFSYYAVLMDTGLYLWALLFAVSFFALVCSIRKCLVGGRGSDGGGAGCPAAGPQDVKAPAAGEFTGQGLSREAAEVSSEAAAPDVELPEAADAGSAEKYIRGISGKVSDLDLRLEAIGLSLSKGRSNDGFVVKFLEDISTDIESLDKDKVKARIEYLLSDLKK